MNEELLARIIEAYTSTDGDQPARLAAVQAILDDQDELDHGALIDAALEQFGQINGDGDRDLTDAQLADLETLSEVVGAVRADQAAVNEAAEQRRARADELARRVTGATGDDTGEDEPHSDDAPGTDSDPATDADPADNDTDGEPAPAEREPAGAGAALATRRPAQPPTRTGGGAGSRLPLNRVRSAAQRAGRPVARNSAGATGWDVRAAADIPGVPAGAPLVGLDQLAAAADEKLFAMMRTGTRQSAQLATFRRNLPAELTARDMDDHQVIEYATNEARLSGGSLVAAGGWCAPSETDYSMGIDPAAVDGMWDAPTVNMARGGLRYPVAPDFASVYSNAGYFHQTEAQAIAGTAKPCWEISCPTMDEVRLDVDGLCITAPILTDRAWPENTRYLIAQSLAAHAHKLNAFKIAAAVAKAGAAVEFAAPVVDPVAGQLSAVSNLLGAVELIVNHVIYRNRLAQGTSLELVAPRWLRGLLKADLRKKLFADPASSNITDAQLDQWLRAANVNPQWVMDWQDAFASGDVTLMGGTVPMETWPDTVDILMYVAGTYFVGGEELVRLDGLYDSTNIRTNTFTALFTEESVGVGKRGYKPYLVRVPVRPTGASAGTVTITGPTL